MREKFWSGNRIRSILLLALFNLVFLGTEYVFVDVAAVQADAERAVLFQNYVLGSSVAGFLLFSLADRLIPERFHRAERIVFFLICMGSFLMILRNQNYQAMLTAGCILFVMLGLLGSRVYYVTATALGNTYGFGRTAGMGYALGIMLQFVNNMLIRHNDIQAAVLLAAIMISVFLTIKIQFMRDGNICTDGGRPVNGNLEDNDTGEVRIRQRSAGCRNAGMHMKHPVPAAFFLIISVALMTCIFSTLDNEVTLVHAAGGVNIGSWPRLLLMLSGLCAGFLFDWKNDQTREVIMYCVMLLSTICILLIQSGGPFLIGLIIFYLTAGFFAVYFAVSFLELSFYMKEQRLFAGLGRAVNNFSAVCTGALSLSLVKSGNSLLIYSVTIVLFVFVGISLYLYAVNSNIIYAGDAAENPEKEGASDNSDKMRHFAEAFGLTERETEVMEALLTSDEGIQGLAEKIYISRAMLYRHIASLNEKTGTQNRIGLIQFYYTWNEKCNILQ